MSDETQDKPAPRRINPDDPKDVAYWAKLYDTTPERVQMAIGVKGTLGSDVFDYLLLLERYGA